MMRDFLKPQTGAAVLFLASVCVLLFGSAPALAQGQQAGETTKAASAEEAVVITFKRLCLDLFPDVSEAQRIANILRWKSATQSLIVPLCRPSGEAKMNWSTFIDSAFGFDTLITLGEVTSGQNRIQTCAVERSDVDVDLALNMFRQIAGSGTGQTFDQGRSRQTTWGMRKGQTRLRVSAFDYRPSRKNSIVFTICNDQD
jgi:hypothetical protein